MSSTASIILKFLITKEKVINIHNDIAVLLALFGESSLEGQNGDPWRNICKTDIHKKSGGVL
jgi:hypothetical protein